MTYVPVSSPTREGIAPANDLQGFLHPISTLRLPLPRESSSDGDSDSSFPLMALCAEPGMGQDVIMADTISRAGELGIRYVHRSYRGVGPDEAAANVVKTARTAVRGGAPALVVLEDIPPFDEACVRRVARALRRMALAGITVVLTLNPEAVQLLDAVPECFVAGVESLLVRPIALASRSEPASELRRLTRGIPCLVRSLGSTSPTTSGALELPSSYYEALSSLVSSSLRLSLSDEELRLRLAMLLLGQGSLDDLVRVTGGASLDVLSTIAHNAPLFGISERMDSFHCLQSRSIILPAAAFLPIRSLCALFPEVCSAALEVLVDRGDCARASVLYGMPGGEDGAEAILGAASLFLDAGEASLIGEVLERSESDMRAVSRSCHVLRASFASLTERHLPPGIDSLPLDAEDGSPLEPLLLVEVRRALRRRLEPLRASPDALTPLAHRLIVHRETSRLIVEGRLTAAMRLLVSGLDEEGAGTSLSGELLKVDRKLLNVLLLEGGRGSSGGPDDEMRLLASSDYDGVRLLSSLSELLGYLRDFDGRGMALANALAVRAERSGDAILLAASLLAGVVFDLRSGIYTHASVRARRAAEVSDSAGARYLMRVACLLEAVSGYLMGDRAEFPSSVIRERDDLGRVGALVMSAMGSEPDEPGIVVDVDDAVPRNALWLLLVLSHGEGALSAAIRDETPSSWARALSGTHPGRRQALRSRGIGREPGEGAFALIRDGEVPVAVTPVELTLLGEFTLRVRGKRIDDWKIDQRNAHAMLEYLALRKGATARRYQLVDQVWPENDYASGFNKVYQATSIIRSAVGEVDKELNPFITRRSSHEVALDREIVSCDVDVFRECAREVSDSVDDERTLRLAQCVEKIYGGDLYMPSTDATGFIAAAREELRDLYVDAMVAGSEAALRLGHGRTATRMAQDALCVDDMREDALIALVCALRASGRVPEAERQYRRYAQRLAQADRGKPSKRLREALGER